MSKKNQFSIVTRGDALNICGIDGTNRSANFIASTAAIDSHGDVVEQDWILDHFKSNPVILYGHASRELPIGQATRVEVRGGQLEATIKFASAEANPRAEEVWRLVQEGVLRAVSVGFMPTDGKYEIRDNKEVFVWKSPVLKEISVVSVPANHEALARMKAAFTEAAHEQDTMSPALPGLEPDNAVRKASETMELKDALAKIEALTIAHAKLEVEAKSFDDKAKAASEARTKAETAVRELEAKVKTQETEKAAFEAQTKSLLDRAEKAEKLVAELEAKTIEQEVEALVGDKITADEKPLYVDLRKTNAELFKKMIDQRTPMRLAEEITKDGKKNGAPRTGGDTSDLLEELTSGL